MVRLLDINILLALTRSEHVAHDKVRSWFRKHSAEGWATCAVTETGFVRIVSNPAFFDPAPDVPEAVALLTRLTQLPDHHFWTIDLRFQNAAELFGEKLVGHQQVTDAYLLALTIRKKGQLVTLDRGVKTLGGPEHADHVLVL